MHPLDVARAVVRERHPEARAAFLGGSVLTSRRTETSDLDIVVLLAGPPAPYRESLHRAGWPVELFVHTEDSWHGFVQREVAARRSPLLWMCAEGTLLFDADGIGERLAAEARNRASAGPPEPKAEELEDRRYALTDLLDDLAGSTDESEKLFIVTELARRTGELALLTNGSWLGGGKWLGRRLDDCVPGLARSLNDSVQQALVGHTRPLVVLVDEVLNQAGGRLWGGYRRSGTP